MNRWKSLKIGATGEQIVPVSTQLEVKNNNNKKDMVSCPTGELRVKLEYYISETLISLQISGTSASKLVD